MFGPRPTSPKPSIMTVVRTVAGAYMSFLGFVAEVALHRLEEMKVPARFRHRYSPPPAGTPTAARSLYEPSTSSTSFERLADLRNPMNITDPKIRAQIMREFAKAGEGLPLATMMYAEVKRPKLRVVADNCGACAFSGMGPDDVFLTCGHPDAGTFGVSLFRSEPASHCVGRVKFEQHPGRNADGTLKGGMP